MFLVKSQTVTVTSTVALDSKTVAGLLRVCLFWAIRRQQSVVRMGLTLVALSEAIVVSMLELANKYIPVSLMCPPHYSEPSAYLQTV